MLQNEKFCLTFMFVLIINIFASSNHDRGKECLSYYVQNVCMTYWYGVSGAGTILTKNLHPQTLYLFVYPRTGNDKSEKFQLLSNRMGLRSTFNFESDML
jgi:hypothetical protein